VTADVHEFLVQVNVHVRLRGVDIHVLVLMMVVVPVAVDVLHRLMDVRMDMLTSHDQHHRSDQQRCGHQMHGTECFPKECE
jgi:hypothetical protein